jgi:hypothetical protein
VQEFTKVTAIVDVLE